MLLMPAALLAAPVPAPTESPREPHAPAKPAPPARGASDVSVTAQKVTAPKTMPSGDNRRDLVAAMQRISNKLGGLSIGADALQHRGAGAAPAGASRRVQLTWRLNVSWPSELTDAEATLTSEAAAADAARAD
jgi:hypothetical protein